MNKIVTSKRTPDQQEIDLNTIAELLLRGRTAYEMVDILNARDNVAYQVNLASVQADISKLRNVMRKKTLGNLEELRATELAKLDLVEREAFIAWEASKKNKRKQQSTSTAKTTKTINYDSSGEIDNSESAGLTPDELQATVIEETSSGDPRNLEIILKTISLRAKLTGLANMQTAVVGSQQSSQPVTYVILPDNNKPSVQFNPDEFERIVQKATNHE